MTRVEQDIAALLESRLFRAIALPVWSPFWWVMVGAFLAGQLALMFTMERVPVEFGIAFMLSLVGFHVLWVFKHDPPGVVAGFGEQSGDN